jgi:hypothetical protein
MEANPDTALVIEGPKSDNLSYLNGETEEEEKLIEELKNKQRLDSS